MKTSSTVALLSLLVVMVSQPARADTYADEAPECLKSSHQEEWPSGNYQDLTVNNECGRFTKVRINANSFQGKCSGTEHFIDDADSVTRNFNTLEIHFQCYIPQSNPFECIENMGYGHHCLEHDQSFIASSVNDYQCESMGEGAGPCCMDTSNRKAVYRGYGQYDFTWTTPQGCSSDYVTHLDQY